MTSDLTRAECLVNPIRAGDNRLQADYMSFLNQTLVVNHTADVFNSMAMIRAATNYKIPDALHLATAIHYKCDSFLTNDNRLAGFAQIGVELLP